MGWNAGGRQLAHFVEPSITEHGDCTRVDSRVKGSARRQEPDFLNVVTFQAATSGAMNFADGLSSQDSHLDRANHLLCIAWANSRGIFGIQTHERAMKI